MMARCILIFMLASTAARAELQLNGVFKDNMVLQRGAPVSVYGTAAPGRPVTVAFAGQTGRATADADGRWELKLKPMTKSFDPQVLAVASGGEKSSIQGVLVGDVWLCGGQSNMAHAFHSYPLLVDRVPEINDPAIRALVIQRRDAAVPDEAVLAQHPFDEAWREARAPWARLFSPTAYYFAAKLRHDLEVPVGLIVSAVGGTQIQRWMPREAVDELQLDPESSAGAGVLYNAMIHPLRKFTIRGVIWYQGESNGRIPHSYYALSIKHIQSWREVWKENNPHLAGMPFFTAQIAPFRNNVDGLAPDAWAYIRDAQLKTLALPHTGLAVTVDVGEFTDIHPQDKQPVGERLALWAIKLEGQPVVPSGPLFERVTFDGNRATIRFRYADAGLETRRVTMSSRKNVPAEEDPDAYTVPAGQLAGFTVCGEAGHFVAAQARIVGEHVEVWSDEVEAPRAVRYGWSTFPLCNLYNAEGLPASPFRTDDFPVPDVQGRKTGQPWDGDTTPLGHRMQFNSSNAETAWVVESVKGRSGFCPAEGQDGPKYAYCKLGRPEWSDGKRPRGTISIVYFDTGVGTLSVQYDSGDPGITVVEQHPGAWKLAAKIKLQNSGCWRIVEIPVADALLNGRCNGADIRINSTQKALLGGVFYRPAADGS